MIIIGSGKRAEQPLPLLNLRPLYRNVIFAENHFGLAKWIPLLSVASSSTDHCDT